MRVAAKLTLAMMVGIVAVLVLHAYLHVQRVTALYEREMRDDFAILGRSLANATSELWRVGGVERARHYVEQANERHARTEIELVELRAPEPTTEAPGAEPNITLHRDTLAGSAPVVVDGSRVGNIELRRFVRLERQDLHGIIATQVATTAALALVCLAIAAAVGLAVVGRPVQRLIEQSQRVASGDFSAAPEVRRRDELGRLARQMNAMAQQLSEARALVREQSSARTVLLEQLRHADRLSTLGKIASGVAHQLGTPLNVISGRASLIASGETEGADIATDARIIVEHVKMMTGTIRQLLDFARRQGVQKKPTIVVEVIEQARTLIEPIAEQKRVAISSQASPDLRAAIDGGRTLQLLTNLMVNAIQAMPNGGEIVLSADSVQVADPPDRHSVPGEYLRLAVADQGAGISQDDLKHVFEPFFTTKAAGQGTGLGLSVCQGIVREQGGWLEVQSEIGVGSRFTAYLPRGGER
jgi:two-component system, NtrC family, sensor kinase